MVSTTVTGLVTLSRSQRRPAFGSVFLLNNISYLRTHLLTQPINGVDALLSSRGRELLNSNFRMAKANYMDANLSPLLTALAEDKDKSKSSVKDKFTRFFDLLDELVERHAIAAVLPDELEEDERETVCQEVLLLVVPLFQKFVQKNPGKDFSRSESHDLFPNRNVDRRFLGPDPQKCKFSQLFPSCLVCVPIVAPRYQALRHGGRRKVEGRLLMKHKGYRSHQREHISLPCVSSSPAYLRCCIVPTARHYKDIDPYHSIGIFPRNRRCHRRWERKKKPVTQKNPVSLFPARDQRDEP